MKKSISVLLIAILMITLAACGDGMQDGQDGIYRKFHAMQNYMAEVEVTVYGNKGNTIYTMRQFYEEPDKFRCEVLNDAGETENVFVSDGGKTKIQSIKFGSRTIADVQEQMDYMSVNEFFTHYFMDGDAAAETAADSSEDILLKLGDSSGRYRFSQNLWIDEKSLMPKRLVTFDRDGGESLSVVFHSFVINHKDFNADFSVE